MQSKKHSVIEVTLNIFTGWLVGIFIQLIFFPLYGWEVSIADNLAIGTLFTTVAWVRSLYVRRLFNKWTPLQKFHHSSFEVFFNIFTGWLLALVMQIILFPMFGIDAAFVDNITLSMIFTVSAVVRGLYFRRLFNKITHKLHLEQQQQLQEQVEENR